MGLVEFRVRQGCSGLEGRGFKLGSVLVVRRLMTGVGSAEAWGSNPISRAPTPNRPTARNHKPGLDPDPSIVRAFAA